MSVNEIFEATNRLRTNPQSFIPYLEHMLKHFKGNTLYMPGQIGLCTDEGPSAVHECIQVLKRQKPLHKLNLNQGLCKAASDHANDTGPKGMSGHTGSDGSSMSDRIQRYAEWSGNIGENCNYGGDLTADDVIMQLAIDDGVSSRGHRENLLNPKFNEVGIAVAQHKEYGQVQVFDFATQAKPKGGFSSHSHQQQPSSHTHQQPTHTHTYQQPSYQQHSHNTYQQPSSQQKQQQYKSYQPSSQQQQQYSYQQPQQQYSYVQKSSNTTSSYNNQQPISYKQQSQQQYSYPQDQHNNMMMQQQQQVQKQGGGNSSSGMPEGCVGKSTQTQTQIRGNKKTVTTTTTYKFKDGSTKTETNVQESNV